MVALSASQQRILDRMHKGATLSLERGKYKLSEGAIVRTVNSQTVEVLKDLHLIEGTIIGKYHLTNQKGER